jgi:hypothetical protein
MSPRRRLVRRRRRALAAVALLSAVSVACYLIVPRSVHSSEDEQSRRACERMPEFKWMVDGRGGYRVIGRWSP